MELAAFYVVAAGLGYIAVEWSDTRLWILLPLLALVPALLNGGSDGGPSHRARRRARAHPVYRRWVDGRFPFDGEDD